MTEFACVLRICAILLTQNVRLFNALISSETPIFGSRFDGLSAVISSATSLYVRSWQYIYPLAFHVTSDKRIGIASRILRVYDLHSTQRIDCCFTSYTVTN
jgi:tRNA(His) 5'-end guanylyltransferase